MKYVRILIAVAFVLTLCTASALKDKGVKAVYAFGVSACFNDSVVYCTSIQLLDSVSLDKNGFLPKRDQYSYQLKNHVEQVHGKTDYTGMIYFSDSKAKLEKEAAKVKANYTKAKGVVLQMVETTAFMFKKPQE